MTMPTAAELYLALRDLVQGNPVFRSKPVGAPGSIMRTQQDAAILVEDAARKLLAGIRTSYERKPGPGHDWSAIEDEYDGAPIDNETASRDPVGYGNTEAEAIAALQQEIEDRKLAFLYVAHRLTRGDSK